MPERVKLKYSSLVRLGCIPRESGLGQQPPRGHKDSHCAFRQMRNESLDLPHGLVFCKCNRAVLMEDCQRNTNIGLEDVTIPRISRLMKSDLNSRVRCRSHPLGTFLERKNGLKYVTCQHHPNINLIEYSSSIAI